MTLRSAMGMLVAATLLTVTSCSLISPLAAPSEPFQDFTVGEFGGIDGRQNILYVRTDGVALLISPTPAAGRLSGQELSRLQTLLTSKQFRQEVKREAERKAKSPAPVCTDQITTELTMGRLWMSRTYPCGSKAPPTPAFDEIVSILAPAMQGNFDGPVETTEPRLRPLRLERLPLQDQPGYTITIDAAARGMIAMAGRKSELHDLSIQQRDTVRLLLARLVETPVVPCTSTVRYRLHIDPEPPGSGPKISGPDCGFPQRQPEFHALVTLLENAFGV
ncbi:MAG TPA: hypothetical protein VFH20_14095 [Propionibacteriaceae bacterium]|nr:hypothetical protein [Propionibacteriaceae bacterium]